MLEGVDFIIKYGNKKYFKAICHQCKVDRGYVAKFHLNNICGSCAGKKAFAIYGNPMQGKKHSNRERFRKHTHSNVDYNDYILYYSKSGNKRIKYKQKCPQCYIDLGYRLHIDAKRVCKKCRDQNITCYTPEQKRIRCAMKANLVARLKQRLINKNQKSTFDVLDYTVDELKTHLESQFKTGMTWDNYGKWEIDHKKPDSLFKYTSIYDDEFKQCWALNNLQPLWKAENASKGNKYEE